MEFIGKNIQVIHKEDKGKEVSEKINEKQQRKGDGRRRSDMLLMQIDITENAKAKEFCSKSGVPFSHLRHAGFPSAYYSRTVIHKPSFRQVSSLNIALLGHPLSM